MLYHGLFPDRFNRPSKDEVLFEAITFCERLENSTSKKREYSQLLTLSGAKPFMLLAGQYDNEESGTIMQQAEGYSACPEKRVLLNHATGHRPSPWALEQGYDFLTHCV